MYMYMYMYIFSFITLLQGTAPFFRIHCSVYKTLYDYPFYSYITLVQGTMSFVRVMLCMHVCM